jgi:AraC-like DNA-binding protein
MAIVGTGKTNPAAHACLEYSSPARLRAGCVGSSIVNLHQEGLGRLTDRDISFTIRDIVGTPAGIRAMTDLIRSACLTHYAEVARSLGLEPRKMLRRARLPLACLDHQDMRIAIGGVRRLLEASAAAAGIDEFGLRLAERGGLSNLGPVGLVVREQATVAAAIKALARYIHVHNEAMRLRIEQRDDLVILVFLLRGGHQRATRQSTELALGTIHRVICSLFSDDWRPLDVHVAHSAPGNRGYYRHFFRCNVTFDSDFDAILFPASDMDRPIPTAQPQIARYVQSRMETIDIRPENWDAKVSELIGSLLPTGHCTIACVAEHLGCDRRTIHRHLSGSGTSFSEIVDAQRADLALRLIEDSDRPLAGIAGLLGFSAQSAMARWFRVRFGCSITRWRNGTKAPTAEDTTRLAGRRNSQPFKRPSG